MHRQGQGVVQDFKEAAKWYRLAAEQGSALAQYNLGVIYAKGRGVAQNFMRAHMWLDVAEKNGNVDAARNLNVISRLLTAQQIAKAQAMARKCHASNYKQCD